MDTAMPQNVNTSSLFQTSLRQWQADWKARHPETDASAAPAVDGRRPIGAFKAKRLGGRKRSAVR
jgi:hypothetical protein